MAWEPVTFPVGASVSEPLFSPPLTLNIKDHSLDLSVLLLDVTSTGAGGVRMRIAGPLDIAGTVNLTFDADQPPYLAVPNILPGISGIALFYVTPTRAIQVPLITEKLHFASAVDKEVSWSTDMKANSRAGVVIYPAL